MAKALFKNISNEHVRYSGELYGPGDSIEVSAVSHIELFDADARFERASGEVKSRTRRKASSRKGSRSGG